MFGFIGLKYYSANHHYRQSEKMNQDIAVLVELGQSPFNRPEVKN